MAGSLNRVRNMLAFGLLFKFYWVLKTLYKNMSNHRLVFYGTPISETESHELTCHLNDRGEIFINIDIDEHLFGFICLDKSTAIKFAKTLRTEINKIPNDLQL